MITDDKRLQIIIKNIERVTGLALNVQIHKSLGNAAHVLSNGKIEIGHKLIASSSDDEVAAILGHEAAHILLKHIKKQITFDEAERENVKQKMHYVADRHEEKGDSVK